MTDPNNYHEVFIKLLTGDELVARFASTDDTAPIQLFWYGDLAEVDTTTLSEDDRRAVLHAVGAKLIELGEAAVPDTWLERLGQL